MLHLRVLLSALLVVTFAPVAGYANPPALTLGIYIHGPSGVDVLDTLRPELARLGFAQVAVDETSQHLPAVLLRHANGEELELMAGKTCALLSFYGLTKSDETDPPGYLQRFNALHADLKNYLARLPPPHPTFIETVPLEDGCPTD
jgi:hypothetical protein